MGLLDALARAFGFRKRQADVLCIGLDNSGKTTILNQLKPDKVPVDSITPTVGFKVEQFTAFDVTFTVFDMAGQGRYRTIWESYYKSVQGIIFVVDSSDKLRMVVAKDELERLLRHKEIVHREVPILVFANKMDQRSALSALECSDELNLAAIKNKPWNIFASNALSGDGLKDGMEWLADTLRPCLQR